MLKLVTLDTKDVSDEKHMFRVDLTKSKSAWIEIAQLPNELCEYGQTNFETLFDLHPTERGKVIMKNEKSANQEVESSRWHTSYLNTPKWDHLLESSYMFSGMNGSQVSKKVDLPNEFRPFFDHMNQKREMNQLRPYNQVVANWYKDGNDFVAFHSDYSYGMPKDMNVAIVSLYESPDEFRVFSIKAKQNETFDDVLFERVDLKLRHGCVLFMCGDTQHKFRHGVPKMESQSKRLSLTFRYYD